MFSTKYVNYFFIPGYLIVVCGLFFFTAIFSLYVGFSSLQQFSRCMWDFLLYSYLLVVFSLIFSDVSNFLFQALWVTSSFKRWLLSTLWCRVGSRSTFVLFGRRCHGKVSHLSDRSVNALPWNLTILRNITI